MQILDGNDPRVKKFLGRVREWLKDFAHMNDLLPGHMASDGNLLVCLEIALDEFNKFSMPPTSFGLENFPSYAMLVYGTTIHVLISEALLQMRNRLNYTDGGLTIADSDKAGDYMSAVQALRGMYNAQKNDLKMFLNAEQAYGDGVPSEYATVDFFY